MCIFLSKLLGCCRGLCIPSCCLFFALFIYTLPTASAQIVAIEDPIGCAAPTPPENPDPTDDQTGTELSKLDTQALVFAITSHNLSLELGPDQLINQIAIFDPSGRLVFTTHPNSPTYKTQFERELTGVHILLVKTSLGIMHQKLFLQH